MSPIIILLSSYSSHDDVSTSTSSSFLASYFTRGKRSDSLSHSALGTHSVLFRSSFFKRQKGESVCEGVANETLFRKSKHVIQTESGGWIKELWDPSDESSLFEGSNYHTQ